MTDITIWHNPRCSKSRNTLALLEANGITPQVVRYLETPPTSAALKSVIAQLDMRPFDLLRRGEAVCKELGLSKTTPDSEIIAAMVEHPILIERPVVIAGGRAILGRPPENALAVLD